METAISEVRSVIHSLRRDAIHDAATSFPMVKRVMETRVVALLKKREENEKKAQVAQRKRSNNTQIGGKDGTTFTVDVMQGADLPGATAITHANIFARCVLLYQCDTCRKIKGRATPQSSVGAAVGGSSRKVTPGDDSEEAAAGKAGNQELVGLDVIACSKW
jgi:hypothetical protein